MDLVKSIDDILHSPYTGPQLSSLEPLLIRDETSRLTRHSGGFHPGSSSTHETFSNRPNSLPNHFDFEFNLNPSSTQRHPSQQRLKPERPQFFSSQLVEDHQSFPRPFKSPFNFKTSGSVVNPSSRIAAKPPRDFHSNNSPEFFEFGRRIRPRNHRDLSQIHNLPTNPFNIKTCDDDPSTLFPPCSKNVQGSEKTLKTEDILFEKKPLIKSKDKF